MNSKFADLVYCIMRLVIGLNYACHGGQKLLGFPGGGHGAGGMAFIAGIIELVCGLLIAFGLLTRLAAFLASGEMAVAYFMFYVGAVPTLAANLRPRSPCSMKCGRDSKTSVCRTEPFTFERAAWSRKNSGSAETTSSGPVSTSTLNVNPSRLSEL